MVFGFVVFLLCERKCQSINLVINMWVGNSAALNSLTILFDKIVEMTKKIMY